MTTPLALDATVLGGFEVYRTSTPSTAEWTSRRAIAAPHRLNVVGALSDFEASVRHAENGGTALSAFRFGAEVTLDRPPSDKYVSILLATSGRLVLERQDRQFAADPGGSLLVLSPGHGSTHLHVSAGMTIVGLRIDAAELLEALRWIAPHADGDRFVANSPLLAAQASIPIKGVARLFGDVFAAHGPNRRPAAPLAKQLREQVMSTVWLSVPNNRTETIYRDEATPYSQTVQQAIDVIAAESSAEHSVLDLARTVKVGVRALEIAFRRELDDTPHRYLQRTRMRRVHEALRDADPREVTVSEVAARWGFNHLGRFAARYRAEFGVMPSATLHETRG
jgi:AraC-like DNA-binding protein